jgi:hypothetical protein
MDRRSLYRQRRYHAHIVEDEIRDGQRIAELLASQIDGQYPTRLSISKKIAVRQIGPVGTTGTSQNALEIR